MLDEHPEDLGVDDEASDAVDVEVLVLGVDEQFLQNLGEGILFAVHFLSIL